MPPLLQPTSLIPAFVQSRRPRLVVVSIWGGLLPVRSRTNLPLPERTPDPLPPSVKAALTSLAGFPQTAVIVITEHPRTAVEQLFADIPICVAVEKGARYRSETPTETETSPDRWISSSLVPLFNAHVHVCVSTSTFSCLHTRLCVLYSCGVRTARGTESGGLCLTNLRYRAWTSGCPAPAR